MALSNAASEEQASGFRYPLRVVLFYSPGCHGCYDVKDIALPNATRKFGERVKIEKRDINDINIFKELLKYEGFYSSKENETLKVFVGSEYLAGPKKIVSELERVVAEELKKDSRTYDPTNSMQEKAEPETIPKNIKERFRKFGPAAVAGAGLIDGINPCAFTTIIFFISVLAYLGKSKREMLVVGLGFSVSVFLTYLLLGFGAMQAIKVFSVSHGISKGITIATAILAFVLASLSLRDFVAYRKSGSTKNIMLGLPKSIKNRIHRVMRKNLTVRNLLIGSVVIGFLVSLLESVCTGQVYLPTIVFVMKDQTLRTKAFSYLVLYNLMFTAPLIIIFIMAYKGVNSETLGVFLKRNLGAFKLTMAVLFAALGVLVLSTL